MSDVKKAVESAVADCCTTFGSSVGTGAEAQKQSIKDAVQHAMQSAENYEQFQDSFEVALSNHLLVIPGFDPAEVLKMVEEIWTQYIEPFDFDFIPNPFESFVKKLAKPAFMWIAQKVINKILAV